MCIIFFAPDLSAASRAFFGGKFVGGRREVGGKPGRSEVKNVRVNLLTKKPLTLTANHNGLFLMCLLHTGTFRVERVA